MKRTPMKRTSRPTGPLADAVDAVYERAQYSCELCTLGVGPTRGTDHHIHHRRPRRAGGSKRPDTNLPSNLLLLCPGCHEVVESNRAAGYDAGWILRSEAQPSAHAVLIWRGSRWTYLSDDGRYVDEVAA